MNVPSGYTALDMVGFTDKGLYNSATAYVKNDIAHYGGNLWRCLVDDTTNVTPTEGANWTVFLAEPTSAAEDIIAPVEASAVSTRQYAVGKQLILNDTLYRVTAAVNIGDTLVVDTNIALSDTVVEQLASKANASSLAAVATSGSYVDLSNQPTLGTAAAKDVPASGNASTTEVVMGDDTRLSDARNAADVYSWAKASTKPTYNGSEINTSAAQTGTAQSAVAATIASGTSMDAAVKNLLDNDVTLSSQISSVNEALTNLDSAVEVLEKNGDWRTGLRFKNLGTSFTSAQATALANGDLSEFWNGDYWVINGHTWRIVDNSGIAERRGDTVFHTNSNNKVTSLVIMPDSNLVGAEAYLIDNANDSGHGYADCAYRTRTDGKGKAQCKTLASNAFGSSHIATHRELMSTGRGANGATGWGWQDADVELPSEVNIYGHNVWAKSADANGGGAYNTGDRWGQFKLFELAPYMAINRSQNYWLRDIVSASGFAYVDNYGFASYGAPSYASIGLRPHFILV